MRYDEMNTAEHVQRTLIPLHSAGSKQGLKLKTIKGTIAKIELDLCNVVQVSCKYIKTIGKKTLNLEHRNHKFAIFSNKSITIKGIITNNKQTKYGL